VVPLKVRRGSALALVVFVFFVVFVVVVSGFVVVVLDLVVFVFVVVPPKFFANRVLHRIPTKTLDKVMRY
jgi:hypothetical protein